MTGTGFLVGPDLILTNYHVVQALIISQTGNVTLPSPQADPGEVSIHFDYKRPAEGGPYTTGINSTWRSGNWRVDYSPYGAKEFSHAELPQPDELDYALLRLAECVGERPVAAPRPSRSQAPGWLKVSDQPVPLWRMHRCLSSSIRTTSP